MLLQYLKALFCLFLNNIQGISFDFLVQFPLFLSSGFALISFPPSLDCLNRYWWWESCYPNPQDIGPEVDQGPGDTIVPPAFFGSVINGVEPAEVCKIAVDREIFRILLELLPPLRSPEDKGMRKWMNEYLIFSTQGTVSSGKFLWRTGLKMYTLREAHKKLMNHIFAKKCASWLLHKKNRQNFSFSVTTISAVNIVL